MEGSAPFRSHLTSLSPITAGTAVVTRAGRARLLRASFYKLTLSYLRACSGAGSLESWFEQGIPRASFEKVVGVYNVPHLICTLPSCFRRFNPYRTRVCLRATPISAFPPRGRVCARSCPGPDRLRLDWGRSRGVLRGEKGQQRAPALCPSHPASRSLETKGPDASKGTQIPLCVNPLK